MSWRVASGLKGKTRVTTSVIAFTDHKRTYSVGRLASDPALSEEWVACLVNSFMVDQGGTATGVLGG